MTIPIPTFSLIILIDPSGSGKATFAHRHLDPTEILSSEACRALMADNENDLLLVDRRMCAPIERL